ncbi:MAG: hypothetical protein K0M70_10270 [Arenimonas sp.]|uniref:hypothetical protein n=1 Tax=Arenimonas sp. TaxID=1872635 RepID=UPI0025C4A2B6|nr:hypothetical protein [Arenimonas sp.]MBW8368230.1 hypothetical protein [Arenimonas sp.]
MLKPRHIPTTVYLDAALRLVFRFALFAAMLAVVLAVLRALFSLPTDPALAVAVFLGLGAVAAPLSVAGLRKQRRVPLAAASTGAGALLSFAWAALFCVAFVLWLQHFLDAPVRLPEYVAAVVLVGSIGALLSILPSPFVARRRGL